METIDNPYPGNIIEPEDKAEAQYRALEYPNPAVLIAFFDPEISSGAVTLHPWQLEELERLAAAKPSGLKPYKYCLRAANGSGKDKFVIAPFVIWFALCKVRSRVIITSSSGVQLTSQTENYIRDLADRVNNFFGAEIFRIRQRYLYCRLSGSEVRMFATDEKGKAEGYHPLDANSEMAIIVNEGKSVSEDIHGALRRCTGYNYWLEVSTPGEPQGFFYRAATTWLNTRVVTSYDCPHLSEDDREEDKRELGEHSALFRSKHLAEFTSVGGDVVIPLHVVNSLLENPPKLELPQIELRIGGDIAAGGDENSLCAIKGAACIKQKHFREVDTTITAEKFEEFFLDLGISKTYDKIFLDDGGIGHGVIDTLMRRGWININRILNQWAAIKKKNYGNRGAENWYRVKRILEERFFNLKTLDEKTIEQLCSRRYKQQGTGGRVYLQSKREAKAEGFPSPDRADAFVLCFSDINLDTFIQANSPKKIIPKEQQFRSAAEAYEEWENNVMYDGFKKVEKAGRIFNSLRNVYGRN